MIVKEYQATCFDFGLRINEMQKQAYGVCRLVEDGDREPFVVAEEELLCWLYADVGRRTAHVSRVFEALRKAVFLDQDFTFTTKIKIYLACLLSVLMYGTKCWNIPRKHLK